LFLSLTSALLEEETTAISIIPNGMMKVSRIIGVIKISPDSLYDIFIP
jgi:hypothetical protein